MRKIINRLLNRVQQDPKLIPCLHADLPKSNNPPPFIALSKDFCKTCKKHICVGCSDVHVQSECFVSLNINKQLGEGVLRDFNLGHIMQVNLAKITCICGQLIDIKNKNHSICVACGMASCSNKCHNEWINQSKCTYHLNFHQLSPDFNLRSILFTNIGKLYQTKIKKWRIVNNTGLNFITAYANSLHQDFIYLQRGYRNYGSPNPSLLTAMRKIDKGIDYITHVDRICECQCNVCIQRQLHSIGNCEHSCLKTRQIQQLCKNQLELHMQCDCSCQLCSSGIVHETHQKIDCLQYCFKSIYNINC